MKATIKLPPLDYLRECLDYLPETGEFRWRTRPESHFASDWVWKMRNRRYAGKPAGNFVRGRCRIAIDGVLYARSRLAWWFVHETEPPQIDHRYGDKSDDRIVNLRAADNAQNNRNRPAQSNNTSGFKGVSKKRGRWRARITVGGKELSLGGFPTPEAAHAAYCKEAARLHGEFANTGRAS
jgi:hypothetical protein